MAKECGIKLNKLGTLEMRLEYADILTSNFFVIQIIVKS